MKARFDIRWSKESKTRFTNIVQYLREEWSEKEVKKFIKRLQEFEKIVVLFPELYATTKGDLKRAVLSKHNSVLYQIDEKKQLIRVITIFDNRQHPSKLK